MLNQKHPECMKKSFYFKCSFIVLLVSNFCFSQSYKPVDSLFMVKDYLMEIKSNIPQKESKTTADKVKNLERLIRLGTKQKKIFENQLNVILKNNPKEKELLLQKYNHVLQSAILLKTDLKQNKYLYDKISLDEASYLYKNSSALIDRIYYHCKLFKERLDFSTH